MCIKVPMSKYCNKVAHLFLRLGFEVACRGFLLVLCGIFWYLGLAIYYGGFAEEYINNSSVIWGFVLMATCVVSGNILFFLAIICLLVTIFPRLFFCGLFAECSAKKESIISDICDVRIPQGENAKSGLEQMRERMHRLYGYKSKSDKNNKDKN